MTFKDLLIKPELIDALQVQNITQPTQIQCKAAKPVFDGRDMIACSSTGSWQDTCISASCFIVS